jgi:GABA(A) receptor-associated protein
MTFKSEHAFEKRAKEASSILAKHPTRTPVICEKGGNSSDIATIDKKKFLVPSDLSAGQFLYVIRGRMKLRPEQALFLLTERGTLPPTSEKISDLYAKEKSEDGFLYLKYTGENTFGWRR